MGCAHHGVYVVWCELGRTSMMRERGVSYSEMERNGVLLPVTRLEVEYRAAAHYEEMVRIETRVEAARSRSVGSPTRSSALVSACSPGLAPTSRASMAKAERAGSLRRCSKLCRQPRHERTREHRLP